MRVAVLGAGGVGGLVAAALCGAGEEVTLIAREPTAEHIRREGLAVRSALLRESMARPGAASALERAPEALVVARPAATTALDEPADALVVAVKAPALEAALERVVSRPEVVVPLLNGIEHLDVLRERFGAERVAAGVIRVMSERRAPGEIEHTSPDARVDLAAADAGLRERLGPVAQALGEAGLEVRVGGDEAGVMWSKLARLCPLALTTAAYDKPVGAIRSDPIRRAELDAAVDEVALIARADGAESVDSLAARGELESAPAELSSSMRRDVADGAEPELDAIAGAVLRAGGGARRAGAAGARAAAGRRHGLTAPTVRALAVRVASRAGVPGPPA